MAFECPATLDREENITLGHGGGGRLSARLIRDCLLPALDNPHLRPLHDGARLDFGESRLAFSADSFVVSPAFFPGGDIGSLAVHGTCNDLAMCGAKPLFLSLSLILEEGYPLADLRAVLESIRRACDAADVRIVTGDTKVVEKGKGDGVFINTSGIGRIHPRASIGADRIRPGDRILLSGPIAEHGVCILSTREGMAFESPIESDSAHLWPLVEGLLEAVGDQVRVLRDATRGGVASALNELLAGTSAGALLREEAIPLREEVRGACEIFGLDPLYVANEGKFVAFVAPEAAEDALAALRRHPLGRRAAVLGECVPSHPGLVVLRTRIGGSRVVEMISGEQLPRIC